MHPTREVLMIEDSPGDARLVREAFRELKPPVELRIAADGDAALKVLYRAGEYADAARPSLIFLDFNLPGLDARELLSQMKADLQLRVIPVVIFTASESERDVRDAYQLHANCFLRKPSDLNSFLDAIRSAANFWLNIAQLSPL